MEARRHLHGANEHKVDIPNYFGFLSNTFTKPIFIMQYIIVIFLAIQGSYVNVIVYLCISLGIATLNFTVLYGNFATVSYSS